MYPHTYIHTQTERHPGIPTHHLTGIQERAAESRENKAKVCREAGAREPGPLVISPGPGKVRNVA